MRAIAAAPEAADLGGAKDIEREQDYFPRVRTEVQWRSDVAWLISHATIHVADKITAARLALDTVEILIGAAPFSVAANEILADALGVIRDALTAAWPLWGDTP